MSIAVPACEALHADQTGIVTEADFFAGMDNGTISPPLALEFTGGFAKCDVCHHTVDVGPDRPFLAPPDCPRRAAIAAAIAAIDLARQHRAAS